MTDKKVMQMALGALESLQAWPETPENFKRVQAIEALRTALAQPDEQIDIKGAEMNTNRSGNLHEVMHQAAWDSATRVPEGDIRALKNRIHELEGEVIGYKQILDTQPEQKPVAWFTEDHREDKSATTYSKKMSERWKEKGWPVTPLYTAPQKKEWVGLTGEELQEIYQGGGTVHFKLAMAEAKLKEKNT